MMRWTIIYKGHIGMRPVRISRAKNHTIKVSTTVTGADITVMTSDSLSHLKERLVKDGGFSERDTSEVIRMIMFH